ncbi:MAG: condensation domain-containing protein, partial [Chloroflexota bacterium]
MLSRQDETQVPAAYQTQINDALLTALLLTFAERYNAHSLHFDLEGHGREALFEDIDLYRTVGWFTSVFPVQLSLSEEVGIDQALMSVKEQLRQVPRKGVSYGLLRYLHQDRAVREALSGQPQAQITFNYLGQFDHKLSGYNLFSRAPESVGLERNPDDKRRYLLDINALTENGQLVVKWSYSQNCFQAEAIQNLADGFIQNLQTIIDHCTKSGVGGYTPSDFPLAPLNQTQLEALVLAVVKQGQLVNLPNPAKNIEAIYPPSSMQHLMLLYTLGQPDDDILFTQMRYTLGGQIEVALLRKAWQQMVNRHPALRTAFIWDDTDSPLQIVWQQAHLAVEEIDLRQVSSDEHPAELSAILTEDRTKGFNLVQPPLMRVTLVRLADDVTELVWSSHHLVMDRWCITILLREMFLYYNGLFRREAAIQADPVRPFSDYIEWLHQQDEGEAEEFWRQRLAGFTHSTLLARSSRLTPAPQQTVKLDISSEVIQPLQALARQHQLTINTLAQGIWALFLSHHCNSDDVLFGAAVSGRPADIPGIESMVGSFINNLPVRATIDRTQPVSSWLKQLQSQQAAMQPYEYVALADIHSWSDLPQQAALFDTLLIFQAPITVQAQSDGPLEIVGVQGELSTAYPFTLSVFDDGDQLRLWGTYNPT